MADVMIAMGALLIACAIPVTVSFCIIMSKFDSRVDTFDDVTGPAPRRRLPRSY